MYQRSWCRGLAALLFVAANFCIGPLLACDTPVYRYAMYRWTAAPFEVYFFHDKPLAEADHVRHKPVSQLIDGEAPLVNTSITAVDLTGENALEQLPPHVRKAWTSSNSKTPGYLISSPQQVTLFAGDLSRKDLQQLIESPARRKIGEYLEAGKACVFVLLEGKAPGGDDDAKQEKKATDDVEQSAPMTNAQAQKELETFLETVKSGALDLTSGPGTTFEETPKKKDNPHQAAMIRVSRDDPQEQWLVKMLLNVESDLAEFDAPMVFAVYGRARALPPYIGRGITQDNLIDCLQFLTGACSCTVKEQNPGVDLLVSYDWEAASAAVAEKFGAEEGNEQQLGSSDLFPELIIPAGANDEPGENTTQIADAGQRADGKSDSASDPDEFEPAGAADVGDSPQPKTDKSADVKQQASRATTKTSDAPKVAVEASYSIYAVGGGMLLALLVLLAATFIVLRPR